jgi:hypothetical protein
MSLHCFKTFPMQFIERKETTAVFHELHFVLGMLTFCYDSEIQHGLSKIVPRGSESQNLF